MACLRRSTTVYVGNLAFHTTEEQIHELFSTCGPLTRIVMGLDKNAMTPCGFCFVQYGSRRDTEDCVKYLNGARLDERDVRIDFDWCGDFPCILRPPQPCGCGSALVHGRLAQSRATRTLQPRVRAVVPPAVKAPAAPAVPKL